MFVTPKILQRTSTFYRKFPKPWLLKIILKNIKGEKIGSIIIQFKMQFRLFGLFS